jgi:hypothetical protein
LKRIARIMRSPYIFLLCCICFISCKSDRDTTTKRQDSSRTQIPEPQKKNSSDTLIISSKTAVVYEPDTIRIQQAKASGGEENFYIGADDYAFYINESANYLMGKGVTVINSKEKKFLKFISSTEPAELIKLDTLSELWGIYLFDPHKKPRLIDITSIEEEYRNYYR